MVHMGTPCGYHQVIVALACGGVGFGAVRWNVKSFLCQTQLQLRLSWRFDNDYNEVSLDIQYHFLGHLVQKKLSFVICYL